MITLTLTEFITALTALMTALITWSNSIINMFLQPPLVVFVGIGVFSMLAGIVSKLIFRKR